MMFESIKKFFGAYHLLEEFKQSPALPVLMSFMHGQLYGAEKDTCSIGDFSDEGKAVVFGENVQRAKEVLSAASPKLAARKWISERNLAYASVTLVTMTKGQLVEKGWGNYPGVSGELYQFREVIIPKALSGFVEAGDTPGQQYNTVVVVGRRILFDYFCAMGLHDELEDDPESRAIDWFEDAFRAACAFQEHLYRQDIGLPPLLSREEALLEGSLLMMLRDGRPKPGVEWRALKADPLFARD